MARHLTVRQQQVYDYIQDRISARGYGPTVREIGEYLGIRSPNGVMCHLRALERKGMISRLANKSRAIELTNRDGSERHISLIGALTVRGSIAKRQCNLFEAPELFDILTMFHPAHRYLLQYSGNDLREYAIEDGDLLLVEPSRDHSETGLTLLQTTGGGIELRMTCDDASQADDQVIGIVVGVLRNRSPRVSLNPPHLPLRETPAAMSRRDKTNGAVPRRDKANGAITID